MLILSIYTAYSDLHIQHQQCEALSRADFHPPVSILWSQELSHSAFLLLCQLQESMYVKSPQTTVH